MRPGTSPIFRLAQEADAADITALVTAAYAEEPGGLAASGWRDERIWVAELGGMLIGCVGHRQNDDGGFELCRLAVAPEARSRGLGRQLIGIVLTEARTAGAGHVEVHCDIRFARVLSLFAMLGFEQTGEPTAGEDGLGPVTCLLRKALQPGFVAVL